MDEGLGALEGGVFEDAAGSDVVLVGPDPVEPEERLGFFDPVREIHWAHRISGGILGKDLKVASPRLIATELWLNRETALAVPFLNPPDRMHLGCTEPNRNAQQLHANELHEKVVEELVLLEEERRSIRWKKEEAVEHSVSEQAPEAFCSEQLSKLVELRERVFDLPHPTGMSGGGCWTIAFSPTKHERVWHPGRNLGLSAVQTSYKDPNIILEPRARWDAWLAEVLRDVDRAT